MTVLLDMNIFNLIKWTVNKLKTIDLKIRKILLANKISKERWVLEDFIYQRKKEEEFDKTRIELQADNHRVVDMPKRDMELDEVNSNRI